MDLTTSRKVGEDFDAYAIRLYENKAEYDIDCEEIAKLLNAESATQKDESAWRKYYTAFRKGIEYATGGSGAATRILALSDFHYPFNLPASTFADYAGITDVLVLNGDLIDCQSISKFNKLYRVPIIEELVGGRQYIIDVIDLIKPKQVYITVGNHEKRLGSYLAQKMSELASLVPENALDYIVSDGFYNDDKRARTKVYYKPLQDVYADSGIEIIYDSNWFCKVGKTIFCHPQTFSTVMLKTTEKAVNYFFRTQRDFDTVVLGHTHQLGSYMQGDIHLFEMGTCSRTDELNYMEGRLTNPQQKGFVYICQDAHGNIISSKTKLINT